MTFLLLNTSQSAFTLICYSVIMKIYTRAGDEGRTSLLHHKNLMKSNVVFNILGTLDELNAALGLLHLARIPKIKEIVISIQNDLFSIGALVANSNVTRKDFAFLYQRVKEIEDIIDALDEELPPLKNFILPGGTEDSARLHLSRAICRRLERLMVSGKQEKLLSSKGIDYILQYTNRLSDLLFVLARYANHKRGVKDIPWKGLNA